MEPAGLAVGLLGLAGLFNTCLEVVNRYDSWKSFGADLHSLTAQFETQKIRLERWGEAVGIERDGLSSRHHELLDDPRILSNAKNLLSSIKDSCGFEDNIGSETVSGKRDHTGPPRGLRRQRLNWALRDKEKRIAQIAQFSSMVDDLLTWCQYKREVVNPIHIIPSGTDLRYTDVLANQAPWVFDLNQVLAGIEREKEAERRRDIQGWLLGDHCQNELYEVYVKRSVEESCKWVLDRPWFLKWSSVDFPSGSAKYLWINGPAGFGKSILCAKLIQHLLTSLDTPVAYFLCDSETRVPFVAVRFWISQLVSHERALGIVRGKWETTEAQRATRAEILSLMQEIISAVPGCTLVLDGLDECDFAKGSWPGSADDSISKFLESLRQVTKGTSTRVLIMSRNEPEIRYGLMGSGPDDDVFEHQISPDDVRDDVVAYSRSIVNEKLSRKPDATKDGITKRLAERCNGQFLWVRLQQETLRSGKSERNLQEAISSTPPGIEHFYERNWKRIMNLPDEDRTRAFSILHWTAFSVRPLTVSEISGALVVGDDSQELHLGNLPDTIDEEYISTEITQLCGSLLEVRDSLGKGDSGWKTLHLTHFSVKEYMLRNIPTERKLLHPNSALFQSTEAIESMVLARKCLRFVNSQEAWLKSSPAGARDVLDAFRTYAAKCWYQKALVRDMSDPVLVDSINRFFDPANPNWVAWKTWLDLNVYTTSREQKGRIPPGAETASPLYYASRLGLEETVKYLIQEVKSDVDARGYFGKTSLGVASKEGDMQIVRALLDQGADPSLADMDGQTPLSTASNNGHAGVVKLLIESGADLDIASNDGWTPISMACYHGHTEVVRLLLDHGADLAVETESGWGPFNMACRNGHTEVIKLLLDNGANANITSNDGWSPMHVACDSGHTKVVRLLIKADADSNIGSYHGLTPIHAACDSGHTEVVKTLLQHGVDVNIATDDGWTPINVAASRGHAELVKLFLQHGADVHVSNTTGLTPLSTATSNNHVETVKLLLEWGANTETKDSYGATPLMRRARRGGAREVANMLLHYGANVETRDSTGSTPLAAAFLENKADMAKLLLSRGADSTAKCSLRRTPIMYASLNDDPDIIELLLQKGADPTDASEIGETALHFAACAGRVKSATVLLQSSRVNVDALDRTNQTPLFTAAARGYFSMVDTLLSHNANPNRTDSYGSTPLSAAVRNGHTDVVRRLIVLTESPINHKDGFGRTLLRWASKSGESTIMKIIRDRAIELGMETDDVDFSVELTTLPLTGGECIRECDVCAREILNSKPYYNCHVCVDFDICLECFEMGMQCLSASHKWTNHQHKEDVDERTFSIMPVTVFDYY